MDKNNSALSFIIGLLMLMAGLYWLLSSIYVTGGSYSFFAGNNFVSSGLTMVPFVIGVIILFFQNYKSPIGWLFVIGGVVIILASVLMNTRFVFRRTSLYDYLLIFFFIGGGSGLLLKSIFKKG